MTVAKRGLGYACKQLLLLMTKFCVMLQHDAVCLDPVFSHGSCCYSLPGCHVISGRMVKCSLHGQKLPVVFEVWAICLSLLRKGYC